MTVRNEIWIDWKRSPRIAWVDWVSEADRELTAEDLLQTLRHREMDAIALDDPKLVNASGRDDLGGGVSVGITLSLQNTRVAFRENYTPRVSGLCSSNDSNGTHLTDTNSGTQFVTDGVSLGDMIINYTDMSIATVINILSETEIEHTVLKNGTTNQWSENDVYDIFEIVQCEMSGGNVVSVDENGDSIEAMLPMANTQVIRTSSSSATLKEQALLEYASFEGAVHYDAINGYAGTGYNAAGDPIGTPKAPSNNLTDTLVIDVERGFGKIHVVGDITIPTGTNVENYQIVGQSKTKSTVTIEATSLSDGLEVYTAQITGTMDGDVYLQLCLINELTYVNGTILQCGLSANKITLGGSDPSHFINCWSEVAGLGTPEIDMGGSGRDLSLRGYSGGIKISNLTGDNRASLDLISGQVIIDATCTAGTIVVRGADHVEDNSGSGCTVVVQDVIDEIAEAVWADAGGLRTLGLMQENQKIDQTVYDGNGHLTSCRVRLYDGDPDASSSAVIATYVMTASWTGDQMNTYMMVKQ